MKKITLTGAFILAFVAILPARDAFAATYQQLDNSTVIPSACVSGQAACASFIATDTSAPLYVDVFASSTGALTQASAKVVDTATLGSGMYYYEYFSTLQKSEINSQMTELQMTLIHLGGATNFTIGTSYTVEIFFGNGGAGYTLGEASGTPYYQISTIGTDYSPPDYPFPYYPLGDTTTHYISVTPANGTTTATTTTLGQDVYVNASDLSSTTAVTTTYSNAYCSSVSDSVIDAVSNTLGQGCSFSLTWNIASSGESSYSTTTTFTYGGTWRYVSTISNTTGSWCLFGYCLFSNTSDVAQTSGTFIVGQPNALDLINGYIASSSGELTSLATSTAAVSSLCNPFSGSFSIGSCIYVLIIPDASTTEALVSGVSGKFLTYAPLGYVTRFIAIFGSGTTTPLPVFSYTPPAVVGYSQGAITLNPWNLFGTSSFIGSLTSSSSTGSKTLRQIAEPYWDFLWTLVLALAIIGRITGIYPHIHSRGAQDTATKGKHGMKHVDDETYRYKEKLYTMSKRK